jgi:hypothetical protein
MAKASGGMPAAELAKLSAAYNDLKIEFPEQRNKVNNLESVPKTNIRPVF